MNKVDISIDRIDINEIKNNKIHIFFLVNESNNEKYEEYNKKIKNEFLKLNFYFNKYGNQILKNKYQPDYDNSFIFKRKNHLYIITNNAVEIYKNKNNIQLEEIIDFDKKYKQFLLNEIIKNNFFSNLSLESEVKKLIKNDLIKDNKLIW